MKHHLLNNYSNPTDLILYFAGWGTPPELVADWARPANCDVLLCWDYRDLTLAFDFSPYARVHVLAWSLGVWAADNSLPKTLTLASATAVNGTPQPIDDAFGIPTAIFNGTLDGLQGKFAQRTREKFERRMTGDAARLAAYRQLPQRDLDDITAELQAVQNTVLQKTSSMPIAWQRAIIGEQDAIFPPDNQNNYWRTLAPECRLEHLKAPHAALSEWHDFTDVLSGLNA